MDGTTKLRQRPVVSVVIPTCNRARLVQEAVASVLAQEGVGEEFDMEVVVVDDASSDQTPAVMSQFAQVRCIRLTTNVGEGGARNVGIKASQGKYVAFLDDDDLMLPQRLKLQVPAMEAHPEVGVVYSQNIIRGKGIEKWWPDARPSPSGETFDKTWPDAEQAPSGDVFQTFLKREFVSMDTLLVRRVAFEKAGYFNDYPTEAHYDMFLRLAFHVPFLFVEGNVAVNRVNLAGVFHERLAGEAGCARMLPLVVDRALGMLPDTWYSRRLRQEVHVALIPRIFCMLERLEPIEAKRSYTRIALQTCPWVLREQSARAALVKQAYCFTLGTGSPIASAKAICREIQKAARKAFGSRPRARLLLADIYTEIATTLQSGVNPDHGTAGSAAARAVFYDCTRLRRKDLVWFILRAVIGRRAEIIFTVIKYKRLAQARLASFYSRKSFPLSPSRKR